LCVGDDTAGYWKALETSSVAVPCAEPASLRCTGWSVSSGSVVCGEGYEQTSPYCAACRAGYFPQLGVCVPCPSGGSSGMLLTAAMFAGGLFALFLLTFVVILALKSRHGGSVKQGLFRARDFVTWTFVTWQTLAGIGKSGVYLPARVRQLYAYLTVFELDAAAVVHPACVARGSAFLVERVELMTGLGLALLLLLSALRVHCR
jgi:hypothetical protein